jgi:RNA-directed DNA polymerase
MPAPPRRRGTRGRQAEASGDRERPPDAVGASAHASDAARGQAPPLGQDGTAGRRPYRTRAPDTGGPDARQPTARRGLADPANADQPHRGRDLDRGVTVARRRAGWSALHPEAARGVDGVPGPGDAEPLPAHVAALIARLQQQRDRAPWLRRHDLPQGHGHERRWGLPVRADTRLQAACARLLTAIDAPELLGGREGDRPGRGAGDAVRDRTGARPYGR